jgi:hypothetical protein
MIARAEIKPEQPSATASEPTAAKSGVATAPAKTVPAPARTAAITPNTAAVLPPDEETPADEMGTLPRTAEPSPAPAGTRPPLRTATPDESPDSTKIAPRPAPKLAARSVPQPVAVEKVEKPIQPKPEAVKRETAKAEVQEASPEPAPNRALKQRTRVAARHAPRAVASRDEDDAPAAASERAPARAAAPQPRRPVRTARAARAIRAQGGTLEALLDDFSKSGSDFMHERTYRLGRGYLIERTTPNGTRYFYDRSASAY